MNSPNKNSQNILNVCSFLFGFSLLVGLIPGELKYVKYACPAIFFLVLIPYKAPISNNYISKPYFKLLFFNLFLILFTSLIALVSDSSFENRFILETYFTLSPLLCAYLISNHYNPDDHQSSTVIILLTYIAYFSVDTVSYGMAGLLNQVSLDTLKTFLVDSEAKGESHAGFVLGLLSLFFLITKRYKLFYISIFFVLLSSKRIVYLGVIAGALFHFTDKITWLSKKHSFLVFLFTIIGLIVPIILLLLANGTFDGWIEENTTVSTNQLTQGRSNVYGILMDNFDYPSFVGTGYGSTSSLMAKSQEGITLLHSDLLKLVYEFGIIGFIIWLIYNTLIFTKHKQTTTLYIYLFTLLMTDNAYIYFDLLFVFYYLQIHFIANRAEEITYSRFHKVISKPVEHSVASHID